jgi:nucleotide-binding universal stress UspA family protein
MFKRVLVPLDGSMLAESVLEPALNLAQHAKGTVYLMRIPIYIDNGAHINPEYQRVWTADNDFHEHEDVASYLRKIQDRLLRSGVSVKMSIGEGEREEIYSKFKSQHLDVNTAIIQGAAAEKTPTYEAENNIDPIAMSTHGPSGLRKLFAGSVTEKVICISGCAILILHPAE